MSVNENSDLLFETKTFMDQMRIQVTEEFDKFIIETIMPFAKTVKYNISKEELKQAILLYYSNEH